MALTAYVTHDAVGSGSLSGPMAALLVLLPLALADVALPLADAGQISLRTAAAQQRLARLERTSPAVRDTVATTPPDGHAVVVRQARARWERGGPLTREVSLCLEPGQRVAVVGPSGSGKSTLAALLLRFLDPDTGTIALGGRPTSELDPQDVRKIVGLVDDDPHVFASNLVENVRLARPDATDEEVERALRRAHLGDWLDALPAGMQTRLGDGAAQVSGGERARLAVARSLLAGHKVLVLDEPLAHLDTSTAESLAREVLAREDGSAAGGEPGAEPGPHGGTKSVLWMTHTSTGLGLTDTVVSLQRMGEVRRC